MVVMNESINPLNSINCSDFNMNNEYLHHYVCIA